MEPLHIGGRQHKYGSPGVSRPRSDADSDPASLFYLWMAASGTCYYNRLNGGITVIRKLNFAFLRPQPFSTYRIPRFQVNTLAHHVFEQIEMHIFGGTASLGVLSATIQLVKSFGVYALLTVLCHVAYHVNPSNTQTLAFSAFLAASVGLAYWMSRSKTLFKIEIMIFKVFIESTAVGNVVSINLGENKGNYEALSE